MLVAVLERRFGSGVCFPFLLLVVTGGLLAFSLADCVQEFFDPVEPVAVLRGRRGFGRLFFIFLSSSLQVGHI
jgi:hypothetical protein